MPCSLFPAIYLRDRTLQEPGNALCCIRQSRICAYLDFTPHISIRRRYEYLHEAIGIQGSTGCPHNYLVTVHRTTGDEGLAGWMMRPFKIKAGFKSRSLVSTRDQGRLQSIVFGGGYGKSCTNPHGAIRLVD